jgi:hypothetical protein
MVKILKVTKKDKEKLRTWEVSWFVNPSTNSNVRTISKTIHYYHSFSDREIHKDEALDYARDKFNIHPHKFLFIKEV